MLKVSNFKYLLIITCNLCMNLINTQNLDSLSQCPSGLETSVWYMGKNGLNWNTGNPGVDSGFAILAGEAQTSTYDRTGKLLFYSANNNIYNANHQLMKNGNLRPYGGSSSTMNLILNHSDSAHLYYYIYPDQITDQLDTFEKKLRYSLIDMRAEGGTGEVIFKNRILMDTSSERVEGIRHCNGKDWWIIGQNAINERFWVWKLDNNGIDIINPTIQSSGKINNIDRKFALIGYLK